MQTQNKWVLEQLRAGRNLTSEDARSERAITRLGARIDDLKRDGWIIETRIISVENRYRQTCHVAEYYLPWTPALNKG